MAHLLKIPISSWAGLTFFRIVIWLERIYVNIITESVRREDLYTLRIRTCQVRFVDTLRASHAHHLSLAVAITGSDHVEQPRRPETPATVSGGSSFPCTTWSTCISYPENDNWTGSLRVSFSFHIYKSIHYVTLAHEPGYKL